MKPSSSPSAARTSGGLVGSPGLTSKPNGRPRKAGAEAPWRRSALLALGTAALVSLAACANQVGGAQGKPLSGYVRMNEVQAAYLGSGSAGSGTLSYRGRSYPFNVGGLGVGGIGVSTIQARGEVYGLQRLSDFPGTYAQGRMGFALGTRSGGDLWLKNGNGVVMHLVAKRTGLMLSLGGDAIAISMKQ
ncbi:MAG: hypothetical protein JO069_03040 [Verrucomicrobia bacterium]|nr:hypothetical protein [Verrucomicrobiota bacterium]